MVQVIYMLLFCAFCVFGDEFDDDAVAQSVFDIESKLIEDIQSIRRNFDEEFERDRAQANEILEQAHENVAQAELNYAYQLEESRGHVQRVDDEREALEADSTFDENEFHNFDEEEFNA